MAMFLVTYRDNIGYGQRNNDSFTADQVILTPDSRWFHFIVNDKIVARVREDDVRVIEKVIKDNAKNEVED